MDVRYDYKESSSYLIYRVGRLLRYQAARFFKERGILMSPEQWGILLKIADRSEQSLSNLVDKAFGDHPNITRLVDGLEDLGYVSRSRHPQDRRSYLVTLTREGREFIDEIMPELVDRKAALFEGLDERDVADLNRMLRTIEANAEQ